MAGLAKKAFNGVTGVIGGAFDAIGDHISVIHTSHMVNLDRKRGVLGKGIALAENAVDTVSGGLINKVRFGFNGKFMRATDEDPNCKRKARVADKMGQSAQKKKQDAENEIKGIDNYKAKVAKKAKRKGIDLSEFGSAYTDGPDYP